MEFRYMACWLKDRCQQTHLIYCFLLLTAVMLWYNCKLYKDKSHQKSFNMLVGHINPSTTYSWNWTQKITLWMFLTTGKASQSSDLELSPQCEMIKAKLLWLWAKSDQQMNHTIHIFPFSSVHTILTSWQLFTSPRVVLWVGKHCISPSSHRPFYFLKYSLGGKWRMKDWPESRSDLSQNFASKEVSCECRWIIYCNRLCAKM